MWFGFINVQPLITFQMCNLDGIISNCPTGETITIIAIVILFIETFDAIFIYYHTRQSIENYFSVLKLDQRT